MGKELLSVGVVILMTFLSSCVATRTAMVPELKVEVCAEPPTEEMKQESAPPAASVEEAAVPEAPAPEAAAPEAAAPPEVAMLTEEPTAESAEPHTSDAVPAARMAEPTVANGKKYLVKQVFYGTDRKENDPTQPQKFYGNQRGDLRLGICEVSIPPDHKMGELESPKWWKLEFNENPNKHVVLLKVQELSSEYFFTELRSHIGKSSDKEAFVFIHGYSVTFEDAARRTAQMAYDLGFGGAPIFYSWPSQGEIADYTVDETSIEWTVPHLKEFLSMVAAESGAQKVHLIAHSMGNRAMTNALKDLADTYTAGSAPLFNQVVLAAPDMDAEIFKRDIAPRIQKTAERVTLYASSNDKALLVSKKIHGAPRAGDAENGIITVPGIDTIDASLVDTSLVGHSYYGDNRSIISDMYLLVNLKLPPDKRNLLPMEVEGGRYWAVKR
ncbi:MAG: alpha/beta fold hydrolase [Planctomycetes bacterium]|nr:alpha/beta fold hydrolase [Planctomycetota bacterium]